MAYFIVDKNTGRKYRKPAAYYMDAVYDTDRGAKIALTAMLRKNGDDGTEFWVVMNVAEYREAFPVKMVERTNLMSGLKYMEAEDTPGFCSPASETYWSA